MYKYYIFFKGIVSLAKGRKYDKQRTVGKAKKREGTRELVRVE